MVSTRPPATESAGARLRRSFACAFQGCALLVRSQANARIHLAATLAVVGAGFGIRVSRAEWCALAGAIGFVWTAEAFNTALETVVDLVSPEHHRLAGRAKDLAAGGVLCAAATAAVIGGIIFGPRLVAALAG